MVVGLLLGLIFAAFGLVGVTDFKGFTSWYAATIAPQVPLRFHTPADPDGLKYHRRLFAVFAIFGLFVATCAVVAIVR